MLNKVTLIGNLGADPEMRHIPSGGAATAISIATTMRWKDKQSGERREATEWHRVVFFNRLAEIVGEYLKKGSQVYVQGRLQTRKWQDKDGQDRYTTEIIADEMHMLGSRSAGHGDFHEEQSSPTNKQINPSGNTAHFPKETNPYGVFDDEIPF